MQKRLVVLAMVAIVLLLVVPLASAQGTTTVPPVCGGMYVGAQTVTGTWDKVCAGSKVWVEDNAGNILGQSVVDAAGSFVITLNRPLVLGEKLNVLTDCGGAAEPYQLPSETCGSVVVGPVPPLPIPEPGTLVLLGSGLAGLAGYVGLRWRARK